MFTLLKQIINCGFFFCISYAKYSFKKNTDPNNQIILFLFCRTTDLIFCASCPWTKKLIWFCLSLEHKIKFLTTRDIKRKIIGLTYQNMQNLFQDKSKKGFSTKKFHEIIVKAFFINATHLV